MSIFLCMQTGLLPPFISKLWLQGGVVDGGVIDCPTDFLLVPHIPEMDGNLNQGNDGSEIIHLCYLKKYHQLRGSPIRGLSLANSYPCPSGSVRTPRTYWLNGDLNQGADGDVIFLCQQDSQIVQVGSVIYLVQPMHATYLGGCGLGAYGYGGYFQRTQWVVKECNSGERTRTNSILSGDRIVLMNDAAIEGYFFLGVLPTPVDDRCDRHVLGKIVTQPMQNLFTTWTITIDDANKPFGFPVQNGDTVYLQNECGFLGICGWAAHLCGGELYDAYAYASPEELAQPERVKWTIQIESR